MDRYKTRGKAMNDDDYKYHLIHVIPTKNALGVFNPFPVDMLFQEILIPASSYSSKMISNSFYFSESDEAEPIALLRARRFLPGDDDDWEPDHKAWESHGWKVLNHKRFEFGLIETLCKILRGELGGKTNE